MYEYENTPLYQKGEEVLIETGAAPKALHHWRNIEPTVGPELDRMFKVLLEKNYSQCLYT